MAQSREEVLLYRRNWKRNRYQSDASYRQKAIDRAKRWIKNNPDKRFDAILRRRYGITIGDYERMLAEQDEKCAICEKPETRIDPRSGEVQRLSVDHCHKTKVVRGLLCRRCNHTLGQYEDDPQPFLNMAAYLARDFGIKR